MKSAAAQERDQKALLHSEVFGRVHDLVGAGIALDALRRLGPFEEGDRTTAMGRDRIILVILGCHVVVGPFHQPTVQKNKGLKPQRRLRNARDPERGVAEAIQGTGRATPSLCWLTSPGRNHRPDQTPS
jgi:hypothetical protein